MKRFATALASFALVIGAMLPAGAQTAPPGNYPAYRPGTSTWREGPPQAGAGHSLLNRPHPWTQTTAPFPLIDASFRHALQASSVRVMLDGRDVTAIAQIHSNGFEFTPARRLTLGAHSVRISGMTLDGHSVTDSWTFNVIQ